MPNSCASCCGLQKTYQIDPAGLIHALQNHDELTLELVHFWTRHKDATFTFRGKTMKGSELREIIRAEMHGRLLGPAAPYNLKAANGVSCTTATVAAAALGIRDVSRLTEAQRRDIQRAHLLVAMYNAMQPGVFALSGWDLVGALTLPADSVKTLLADGDTRWINRGSYDLLGTNPGAVKSSADLPRTQALYGTLPEQLKSPGSFVWQLKKMLRVRAEYRINESEQIDVPAVKARGLVVMVHRLPDGKGHPGHGHQLRPHGRPRDGGHQDRAARRRGHGPPRGEGARHAGRRRAAAARTRSPRRTGSAHQVVVTRSRDG